MSEMVRNMYFMPKVFGRQPMETLCTNCNERGMTNIEVIYGMQQRIYAMVFAMTLVLLPVFWLPLIFCCWNDVIHYCPNCKFAIGRHSGLDYCC